MRIPVVPDRKRPQSSEFRHRHRAKSTISLFRILVLGTTRPMPIKRFVRLSSKRMPFVTSLYPIVTEDTLLQIT
jgi:hypothetical protein